MKIIGSVWSKLTLQEKLFEISNAINTNKVKWGR